MKKLIAIFLSILLTISTFNTVCAQEPVWIISAPPEFQLAEPNLFQLDPSIAPNARLYPLRASERAPVAGILLNAEASAWLSAQYIFVQQYWITEMNRRVQLTRTWADGEIAGLQNRSESEQAALQVRLDSANESNEELNRTVDRLLRQNRSEVRKRKISLIVLGAGSGLVIAVISSVLLPRHN